MPDVWAHLICGDKTMQKLTGPVAELLATHQKIFYFGCQGPDLFYYYNFWPWTLDRRGAQLAHIIHYERCQDFFAGVFEHIKDLPEGRQKEIALAYAYGLLCHWAIDRVTHPYIHYISGVYVENDKATWPLRHNHKRVEAAIDTILTQEHYGLDTTKVPFDQLFNLGPTLPQSIAKMYESVLPHLYPKAWARQLPGVVDKAYRDMMAGASFGLDPHGIKRAFFSLVDAATAHRYNFRYFYSRPVDQLKADYFNTAKKEWLDPVDRSVRSHLSLYELMEMAIDEARHVIEATRSYLQGESSESSWRAAIGNLSFSTGRDCSEQVELKHFAPILD